MPAFLFLGVVALTSRKEQQKILVSRSTSNEKNGKTNYAPVVCFVAVRFVSAAVDLNPATCSLRRKSAEMFLKFFGNWSRLYDFSSAEQSQKVKICDLSRMQGSMPVSGSFRNFWKLDTTKQYPSELEVRLLDDLRCFLEV